MKNNVCSKQPLHAHRTVIKSANFADCKITQKRMHLAAKPIIQLFTVHFSNKVSSQKSCVISYVPFFCMARENQRIPFLLMDNRKPLPSSLLFIVFQKMCPICDQQKQNPLKNQGFSLWQQTQFSIRVALGCKVALKCNPRSVCNRPTNWNLTISFYK